MSSKWPSDRTETEKLVYGQLEKIRTWHRCNNHPSGDISIVYSSRHGSWIISCEETAAKGSTPRSDGKCFWHYHIDPEDWNDKSLP